MPIRINKVTKECSVGLQTLVDFLNKKGFHDVEANPNASLTDEQYAVALAEFKKEQRPLTLVQPVATRKTKEKKETIVLTESGEALPPSDASTSNPRARLPNLKRRVLHLLHPKPKHLLLKRHLSPKRRRPRNPSLRPR